MTFSPRVQPFRINGIGDNYSGLYEDISTRSLDTVRIGGETGKINTGIGNAFVGYQCAYNTTNAIYMTCIGYRSAYGGTNNTNSVFIGAFSGAETIQGQDTVFVGFRSGELSRNSSESVGIGAYSLRENVSGTGVVAVGYRAGERSLDGGYNTFIGAEAGQENRSGFYNTMGGYRSGRSSFLGDENTYFGAYSGYSNSYGTGNTFIGFRSGELLSSGDFNVAVGAFSMQSVNTGSCNVTIGSFSMNNPINSNEISSNNVLIGMNVAGNATSIDSVVIGYDAAINAEFINTSVLIGSKVGNNLLRSNSNVLIGYEANTFEQDSYLSIAIGSSNTTTHDRSIVIGNNVKSMKEYSVIVGNNLSSDGNNTILVGKDINTRTTVVFQDLLSYNSKEFTLVDGKQKFGITEINYTDTLSNIFNSNALAGIITSNEFNTDLSSINSYNLDTELISKFGKYFLYNPASVGITSGYNISAPIPIPLTYDNYIYKTNVNGEITTNANNIFLTDPSLIANNCGCDKK
jgi:hypothetical protein